jgi:hypothetical protein
MEILLQTDGFRITYLGLGYLAGRGCTWVKELVEDRVGRDAVAIPKDVIKRDDPLIIETYKTFGCAAFPDSILAKIPVEFADAYTVITLPGGEEQINLDYKKVITAILHKEMTSVETVLAIERSINTGSAWEDTNL